MMNRVLQKLSFVKLYLDVILVPTPGTPEEHFQALEQGFQCLREDNLK